MKRELPDLSAIGDLQSIVVVRLKALGDIVLSLPIVYALRERFPRADIRYLCRARYAEALAGDTGLDGVIAVPEGALSQLLLCLGLRRRKIDLVIDLLSSPRSALITRLIAPRISIGMDVGRRGRLYHHVIPRVILRDGVRVKRYSLEANREIAGMLGLAGSRLAADATQRSPMPEARRASRRSDGLAIGFPAAEPEREWARRIAEGLAPPPRGLVGVAPAATYRSKSWPLERFAELARILAAELRLVPIVLWGPGEERIADEVVAMAPGAIKAPRTGIARLGALIGELRCLVTLDSGMKHLAVVQAVPTVTLFGPTDPCIWDPMTERHRVVYRGLDCAPCRDRDCRPNRCLSEIDAREVADAVAGLLADCAPNGAGGEAVRAEE